MKTKTMEAWEKFFWDIGGTALMAVGIQCFLEPAKLVAGGITGLGIVLDAWSQRQFGVPLPLWLINLGLNLPLFLLSWKFQGGRFVGKTLLTSLLFSLMLFFAQGIHFSMEDYLLSAVYGGVLVGVGLGLVLKGGSTTGGVDLLASLWHLVSKRPGLTGKIFFLDAAIILSGMSMFGGISALYAILSVYIAEKCMKYVLEGAEVLRGAIVITHNGQGTVESLEGKLVRQLTYFQGKVEDGAGATEVLVCVFSQKEIQAVKSIIIENDKTAVFLLMDVREVLGNGFLHE